MTDATDGLAYWRGRLEDVIGLDDGAPDQAMNDAPLLPGRFLDELRAARADLGDEEIDALEDWLVDRHRGYLESVRVWYAQYGERMAALNAEREKAKERQAQPPGEPRDTKKSVPPRMPEEKEGEAREKARRGGTLRVIGEFVIVMMKETGDLLKSHKKEVFGWVLFLPLFLVFMIGLATVINALDYTWPLPFGEPGLDWGHVVSGGIVIAWILAVWYQDASK